MIGVVYKKHPKSDLSNLAIEEGWLGGAKGSPLREGVALPNYGMFEK
jgi:hypothetical protein